MTWAAWRLGGELLPSNSFMKGLSSRLCRTRVTKAICSNIIFLACGYNEAQLNATRISVYAYHSPAGTSTWNVLHFAQNIRSGRFQRFDHGSTENRRRYGSREAPDYQLESITNEHMVFFTSDNDWMSMAGDLTILRQRLKGEEIGT